MALSYRSFWKKFSSLERRAFLLVELADLRKRGRTIPPGLTRTILRSPSLAEDYVNFLRFLDPADSLQLIDIGANTGEWSASFLDAFPNTNVTAIEPSNEAYAELQARFSGDARVRLIKAGASENPGTAQLMLGENSTLNSLEHYEEQFSDDRHNVLRGSEAVPLVRVDDVVTLDPAATRRVLKIDVQGHEESALRGATATLQKIDVALCELSFVNEYKSVPPSFAPVTEILRQAGLHAVIFQEYGTTLSNHRLESDVIYVRESLFRDLYNS